MNIKVNTVFSEDDKAAYQIHRLPKVVSVFFGVERERGAGRGTNHEGEDDSGGEQRAGEPLLQADGTIGKTQPDEVSSHQTSIGWTIFTSCLVMHTS